MKLKGVLALLLLLSLALGVYVRLAPLPALKGYLLLGTDPARYTRLAKIIIENGKLPQRDVMRLVPLGKETENQLTLLPYFVACLYKIMKLFSPNLTILKVAIILPVILSVLTLLMLFLIVRKLLDVYTALFSVNIAAVSPPFVGRTLAGFADKDGLALLLSLIAFYFYLSSFQKGRFFKRIIFSLAFSFSMVLLGLTWQGVGVFIGVAIITEFVSLIILYEYHLEDFALAICRYFPLIIALTTLKTVYRDLSQVFIMLAIGLPIFLLLLSLLCLIANRFQKISLAFSLKGRIPIVFPFAAIILTAFVISWDDISILWDNFLSPFGSNRLAQSIQELQKKGASGWAFWPGAFFLPSCAGVILVYRDVVSRLRMNTAASLILFELFLMGVPFSRIFPGLYSRGETWLTLSIYIGNLVAFLIGTLLLYLAAHRRDKAKIEAVIYDRLFLTIWFALMLILSRSAVRFEFLFAIPAAILGSYAITKSLLLLRGRFKVLLLILLSVELWELYTIYFTSREPANHSLFSIILLSNFVICTMIILLVVFRTTSCTLLQFCEIGGAMIYIIFTTSSSPVNWIGSYMEKSYKLSTEQRPFVTPELEEALKWMKESLPPNATVAAWWEYGSWINLLAEKGTIIDEEQCPYWLYLMARHVFLSQSEREALEFLYTHQAKYLMITSRDIGLLPVISTLGSDKKLDRYAKILYFGDINETIKTGSGKIIYRYLMAEAAREPQALFNRAYQPGKWQISGIYLQIRKEEEAFSNIAILVEIDDGKQVLRLRPEEVYFRGIYVKYGGDVLPCTALINAQSDDPTDWRLLYLSPKVRQSLIVKLFLLNMKSQFFLPIYPTSISSLSSDYSVRIWEIRYPKDLKPKREYLLKKFPDTSLYQSWMIGGD